MTDHQIVRIAELEIDPVRLDAYKTLLAEEIETSVRIEPGVLSISAVSLKAKPASIRILEVYADQRAYDDHLQSPHFLTYKTQTSGMIKSLTLIETEAIKLRAKTDDRSGEAQ